ncbi:uncharacterized protein LOC109602920 isoform X2 [Aethina tumida]|nr:uncharacterized protein LOC109602920 isoform X2 [Aethina tumida]
MDADITVKAKLSGYLEKKGKMKMMSTFKKYWFVLEDRLLLYYRSKDEYDSLSPFKGSINLGPPCIVKPLTSQNGVFQIETRRSTVTLRAENREDQNRWMLAIMSTLNQNSNSTTRLSHFRYSSKDINLIESQTKDGDINSDASSPLTPSKSPPSSPNNPILEKLQKLGAQSYLHKFNEFNLKSTESEFKFPPRKAVSTEKLYGNCVILEGDKNIDNSSFKNKIKSLSMERLPSIIIENDQYKIIDNDIYQTATANFGGHIYEQLPVNSQLMSKDDESGIPNIDYNKNVMPTYIEIPEKLEDVQKCDEEKEDASKKKKKEKHKDKTKVKEKVKEKIERKPSLINRVFGLKHKKKKVEDEDNIYEEVDVPFIMRNDSDTIQILQQLQDILEAKKKKLRTNVNANDEQVVNNELYLLETEMNKLRAGVQLNNEEVEENDLYNLQYKLNNLKVHDNEQVEYNDLYIVQSKLKNSKVDINDEKVEVSNLYVSVDEIKANSEKKCDCPLVPPKHQRTELASPYHDVPKNNQPIEKVLLPPKKKTIQQTRSVDQIVYDLEQQQQQSDESEGQGKVKKLVKQFSTPTVPPDVVLRPKMSYDPISNRYSDELTMLLEQLTQVTNAPLLNPGNTSSLVNPNLTDDELLKLLPTRQRRLSEPDYDVPRSHKSLVNIPKDTNENPIQATRFFGEVLPTEPSELPCNSMTPDSLEADLDLKSQTELPIKQQSLDDDKNLSYSSHDYYNDRRELFLTKRHKSDLDNRYLKEVVTGNRNSDDYIVNSVIYAKPKRRSDILLNFVPEKDILKDNYNVDNLVDSLEMENEAATPF